MVCKALAVKDNGPETLAAIMADLYLTVGVLITGVPEHLWPSRLRVMFPVVKEVAGELCIEEAQNLLSTATPAAPVAPTGK